MILELDILKVRSGHEMKFVSPSSLVRRVFNSAYEKAC